MKKTAFIILFVTVGLLVLVQQAGQAQAPNQVGLVISYGNGQVENRCVSLAGSSGTGLDVLQGAGLALTLNNGPLGAAVCKIGNVGCPADNCFCDSPPNNWNYWHLQGTSWLYSSQGAGSAIVSSGTVEGWSWGNQSSQPPVLSFDQICAAPAPTDTQVPPTATNTPLPTSTATQTSSPVPPTHTPLPSQTPVPPTETPQPSETPLPATQPPADTATPAPASPTLGIQAASLIASPRVAPTITAPPVEATEAAAPTQIASQVPAAASPAQPAAAASGWASATGYPAFGVLVLGLGVILFVVARRQSR